MSSQGSGAVLMFSVARKMPNPNRGSQSRPIACIISKKNVHQEPTPQHDSSSPRTKRLRAMNFQFTNFLDFDDNGNCIANVLE